MTDNRTSSAIAVDNYQEKELSELKEIASTHLTKEYFFWAFGIFISLTVGMLSILYNHIEEHEANDAAQFSKIDEAHQQFINQNTSFQVTYAKIEVQLAEIQKNLLELKTTLNTHDKTK